jgi:hypothetical protein
MVRGSLCVPPAPGRRPKVCLRQPDQIVAILGNTKIARECELEGTGWTTSLAWVHEKMGRIFRLQLQRSLTKFMLARMERLPSAIYDMKWCSAIAGTALNSIWPVLNLSSATFGMWSAFLCCRSNEVVRRNIWQR